MKKEFLEKIEYIRYTRLLGELSHYLKLDDLKMAQSTVKEMSVVAEKLKNNKNKYYIALVENIILDVYYKEGECENVYFDYVEKKRKRKKCNRKSSKVNR